jgi:predicted DNA-binding protein with PD1-like motif
MEYAQGRPGRIFVLRFDDGEDVLSGLKCFIADHEIACGIIHLLGAMRDASLVTGPKEPVIPPDPNFETIRDGWELLALGTVYPSAEGPSLHIHAAAGRGRDALTGCLRNKAGVFMVVEAVIFECLDLQVERRLDPASGAHLPCFDDLHG